MAPKRKLTRPKEADNDADEQSDVLDTIAPVSMSESMCKVRATLPPVRVIVYLAEGLRKNHELHIMCAHMGWKLHNGSSGWNSRLQSAGIPSISKHTLFFVDVPRPLDEELTFKMRQLGSWYFTDSVWEYNPHTSNSMGNRIHKLSLQTTSIFVPVMCTFHDSYRRLLDGKEPKEAGILKTLCGLLGKDVCASQVWFPEAWSDLCAKVFQAFDPSTTWNDSHSPANLEMIWGVFQIHATEDPGGTLLRILRFLSPKTMARGLGNEVFQTVLDGMGECIRPAFQSLQGVDAYFGRDHVYVVALDAHLQELQEIFLNFSGGTRATQRVVLSVSVFFLRNYLVGATGSYDSMIQFLNLPSKKAMMEKHFILLQKSFLENPIPVASTDFVVPFLVAACRSVENLRDLFNFINDHDQANLSSKNLMHQCLLKRIQLADSWFGASVLSAQKVLPRVGDIVKTKAGDEARIIKYDKHCREELPFQVEFLHRRSNPNQGSWHRRDQIDLIIKSIDKSAEVDLKVETMKELDHFSMLLCDYHHLFQHTRGPFVLLEAMLGASCWTFDPEDPNRRLLAKPFLDCYLTLHKKSKGFDEGSCLKLLRQRAEVILGSELVGTEHIADILDSAIMIYNEIASQNGSTLSDSDIGVLKLGLSLFLQLPDDIAGKRLKTLLLPRLAKMPESLKQVLSKRIVKIALQNVTSRIEQLRFLLLPLTAPGNLDSDATSFIVGISNQILAAVASLSESTLASPVQAVSPHIMNLLQDAELWKCVYELYDKIDWNEITCLASGDSLNALLERISQTRSLFASEKDRIRNGQLLLETLLFFENQRPALRELEPADNGLVEKLDYWTHVSRNMENSEKVLVDFLKTCVPHCKVLVKVLSPLSESFEKFTSHRRRAEHVCDWKAFSIISECRSELEFMLQARNSRSAQQLWKTVGSDIAEDFEEEHVASEIVIKKAHKEFSENLRNLLLTIDRGEQANSALKPFIESLVKDIRPPEPPPKGLSQKEARAFIVHTQQKFRADVQSRAEDDISQLLKLFQTSNIELVSSPQVLVERFKNIYRMWQTRAKVGDLYTLLTPASKGDRSMKEVLPEVVYTHKQYQLLERLVHDLDSFENRPIEDSLQGFEDFTKHCPEIQDVLELTLSTLGTVVRSGLLTELREFQDPAEFITFQERWLADYSEGVEEDVCVGFGRVREALQNVVYGDVRNRAPQTVSDFLVELNSVSVADLSLLKDRLKMVTKQRMRKGELAGLTALERSWQLLTQGEFKVSMKRNAPVEFVGTLAQIKDAHIDTITQEELFDLRNQVVMAEIPRDAVEIDDGEQPHTDCELPWATSLTSEDATASMISKPAQRLLVIQQFSWLLDKLREIAQEISRLRDDGHVNFQEGEIKVLSKKWSVEQQLERLQVNRRDWAHWLKCIRRVQPLLSLLFPKELVQLFNVTSEVLQRQMRGDDSNLAHVVRMCGILSILSPVSVEEVSSALESTCGDKVGIASGGNFDAKEVLALINQLLGRLIDRDAMFARCSLKDSQSLVNPAQVTKLHSALQKLMTKPVPFSILTAPIHASRCPELVVLAYHTHLKRLPTPFEVLLCSKHTPLPDLVAFLRRWSESFELLPYFTAKALAPEKRKAEDGMTYTKQEFVDHFGDDDGLRRWESSEATSADIDKGRAKQPLLFCLGNIQELPSTLQIEMQRELVQLREIHLGSGRPCMPLIVLAFTHDSTQSGGEAVSLLGGLRAETEALGSVIGPTPPARMAAWKLLKNHLGSRVSILASSHPCSGKTRYIRGEAAKRKLLYCSLRVNDDMLALRKRMAAVFNERRQHAADRGLALHLDVAHNASFPQFNEFLFNLFMHGSWSDQDGILYILASDDHLFIEVPSQGRPGDHCILDELPLCQALPLIEPPADIQIPTFRVVKYQGAEMHPAQRTLLHEVEVAHDPTMEQALQWLHTLNATKATRAWPAPGHNFPQVSSLNAHDVVALSMEDAACNWSSEQMAARVEPPQALRLFQIQRVLKYVGAQFEKISAMVSNLLVVEQPGSEMYVFYLMYQWLLVQMVVRSARSVSVSAVGSPTKSNSDDPANDHVTRFGMMSTFYNTEHSFVIMDKDNSFSMVSMSEQSILSDLLQNYPATVPNARLFRTLLSQLFHFDLASNRPLHDLRQRLVDLQTSRKTFWELFDVRRPLLVLNAMEEYDKAHGSANEDRKLEEAHEQLQQLGQMHPNAPRIDAAPNRLTFANDAQRMLGFFWRPDYTITVDNLVRLLHVQLRLSAGIPVFFMGETGCGKTSAIHFLARMMGCPFFVINIHGGMRGEDLWKELQPALRMAEDPECVGSVYVLLDESNAMPDTSAIKDVACNQMCEGYILPDNLQIMSLMNPTRFKKVSDSIEGGMDCNEYYESLHAGSGSILESTMSSRRNPFSNTVYPVFEVPESVLTLVWDWGNAADEHMEAVAAKTAVGDRTVFIDPFTNAETIHIEALVHNLITRGFDEGGQNMPALMHRQVASEIQGLQSDTVYWPAMRSIITATIARAQHFIRYEIHGGDGSAVSLRDIKRCVKLLLWMLELYSIRRQAEKDGLPRTTQTASGKLPRCSEVRNALLVSITQCYTLRLNKRKDDLKQVVIQSWQKVREEFQHLHDDFMPTPEAEYFYQPYNEITRFVCDQVKFEPGVARNEAMRENIFSLFVGICTRTSTFLVGKPGSSKSSSMDAVAGSMLNREHPFWGKFPRIHKKTFQCGPLDTPESIYEAAYQVARLQVKQGGMLGNEAVGALILEEIGVTALSPHNPLMSLHSLIDHGVLIDGQWVPLCIIGISNWRVDPAKVNRAFMIFRGDPSPEDIQLTGQQIILGGDHSKSTDIDDELFTAGQAQQLGSVLGAVARVIWESIIRDKTYNHFYGLRDYYGLVKFLHRELTYPLEAELGEGISGHSFSSQTLQLHLVRWAISQNLSCLPFDARRPNAQVDLESALERALVRSEHDRQQSATWQMNDTREALCSTCARGEIRLMQRKGGDIRNKLERLPDRTNRVCTCSTPPVLHRIAWNLEDSQARYLMLVTRDSQALYLLFSTGLARSQGTLVVTGSDLADDNGDAWTLKTLQKIQNAMRLGLLLILAKCRRLYENLLDMTNQHFLVEGGRKYTRLSMQAHSRYFYVHDNFSLAILVEEDEVNNLPPPWLNRFEKANFTYTSVLGPAHLQLQERLTMLTGTSKDYQSFNLCKALLPGFTSDTLSSLVFEVVGTFKQEPEDKTRIRREFQLALFRLSSAASSRSMLSLYCNYAGATSTLSEELRQACMRSSVLMDAVKQLLFFYFQVQAHDSLREVLTRGQDLLFEDGAQSTYKEAGREDVALEKCCPWGDEHGLTLAILTEQFIVAGTEDRMLKKEFQSSDVVVETLSLETIASDHDVDAQLNALFGEHDPNVKIAYLFIVCNVSGSSKASIRDVLFQCHERRCKFIEMQEGKCERSIQRNLVFICKAGDIRSNSARNSSTMFKMYFDARWHWIFVDTLFVANDETSKISLQDYINRPPLAPLSDNHQDMDKEAETMDEVDVPILSVRPGQNMFSVKEILHERILDVVKNLLYPDDSTEKRYERIMERAQDFRNLLQSRTVGVDALLERVYLELEQAPQFREDVWFVHPLSKFDQALSVKENLYSFLSNAVVVVFKEMAGILDTRGNLRFAADVSMAKLWAELFRLPFITGSPGNAAFTRNMGMDPEALLVRVGGDAVEVNATKNDDQGRQDDRSGERCPDVIDELVYPVNMQVTFPFSCELGRRIFQFRAQHDRLDDILASQCPLLLSVGSLDLQKFRGDVLFGAFGGAIEPRETRLLMVLSDALGGGQSVVHFFRQLWKEDRLFVHVRRLVAWGLQSSGWATPEALDNLEKMVEDLATKLVPDNTSATLDSRTIEDIDDDDDLMRKKLQDSDEHPDSKQSKEWTIKDEGNFYRDLESAPHQAKHMLLSNILEMVIGQLFSDVLDVDKEVLLNLESTVMGPVQKIMETLMSSATTVDKETSDTSSALEQSCLERISRRWELWRICYTLKKRVMSFPKAVVATSCVDAYIKEVSSNSECFSQSDVVAKIREFLSLLTEVVKSNKCSTADKNAMSSCVVPIFRLYVLAQSCEADYEAVALVLLKLSLGTYDFNGKESNVVLSPAWMQRNSDGELSPGVPLTYSIASAFVSWILNWFQDGSHHCSESIIAQVSEAIQKQRLGERDELSVLVGQVCFDRLCSIGVGEPFQQAMPFLQHIMHDYQENQCLPAVTRILTMTTLNFLLQSYADVLVQMRSEEQDGVLEELDKKRGLLRAAIWTIFQPAFPTPVQDIVNAMRALSVQQKRNHRDFVLFFLRRLSRNGLDCDSARKILRADAGLVEGSFRYLLLPSSFHEQKIVADFCQTPAEDNKRSPFAIHDGFETASHALAKVLKSPGNCDVHAEALRLLNGEDICWPMPEEHDRRIVSTSLAIVHHSLAQQNTNESLLNFLNQIPWFATEMRAFLQAVLRPSAQQASCRQWLDAKPSRSEAVLHFVVLLIGSNGTSAAEPSRLFKQILQSGLASTESSFMPGVMGSAYLGVLRSVPPEFHVYQGGCGHMFVTGECQNIASQGRCPECNALVGAASYGQGVNGTRRLGAARDILQQWDSQYSQRFPTCTGFRPDGRGANRTERSLTPVFYRILRFCIESAALGQAILGSQGAIGTLMTFDTLCAELEKEISSLKDYLFPDHGDETSTLLYVHGTLQRFAASFQHATYPSWPLPNEQSRQAYEDNVMRSMQGHLGKHVDEVTRVRTAMDAAQEASQRNLAVEEIKLTQWFLDHSQDGEEDNSIWNRMNPLWIPRTSLSMQAFWAHLDAHSGLPVLKLLREYGTYRHDVDAVIVQGSQNLSELALLKHLPDVAWFLRLLLDQFANRMSRNEASVLLEEAIDNVRRESPEIGRKLLVAAESFEKAVRAVWPQVHAHMGRNACINFNHSNAQHLRLIHRKSIMKVPLECFLPSQEGDGVVATALFARLSGIQRQFLARLRNDLSLQRLSSLEVRPLTCSTADILKMPPPEDLAARLTEHVARDLGHTSDTFTFVALEAMEDELLSGLELCQKPVLALEPPEMRYTDEFARLGVLATLHTGQGGRGRVEQELLLPPAAEVVLRQIIHTQPAKRDQLLRYFLVLASLVIQGGVRADQLLWDFTASQAVQLLLDVAQQQVGDSLFQVPQLRNSLRLSHLRSLAALLWDGKVHESFNRELDVAQKESIRAACRNFVSTHQSAARYILAALRRYGYELFSYFRFPETVEKPRGSGNQVENPVWNGNTLGLYLDVDIPEHLTYPDELDVSIRIFGSVLRELEHSDVLGGGMSNEECMESSLPTDVGIPEMCGDLGLSQTPLHSDEQFLDTGFVPSGVPLRTSEVMHEDQHPSVWKNVGLGWESSGVSLDLSSGFDLESIVCDQLKNQLLPHGKQLDRSTPKDGHCLFHALRSGGLLGECNEITIQEMRALALDRAEPEQLQAVAVERNITVDQYIQRMQRDDWGDNLVISLLSVVFQRSITVVTPTMIRTFHSEGREADGPNEESVWVAYNNTNHYYGVLPID